MTEFLVIAPHIDDEVLGCGGILDERFHVHYCGVEEFRIVDRKTRLKEAEACANLLGFSFSVNLDNVVNKYILTDLIGQFESLINNRKPVTLFLPYPSYNQDHRTVLDAALVALRPHDVNYGVKNILLYEEIQVSGWPYREDLLHGQTYHPNCYFPIDIELKMQAYQLHSSQIRSMRSPELVRRLAQWRGFQGGYEYAESFMAIKLSEPKHLSLGRTQQ